MLLKLFYFIFLSNPHVPTIESKLFEALLKAGYLNENRPNFMARYNRASRTDARVSALKQVVSIQMRK